MMSIATFGTKNHLIGWNMAKPLNPNSRIKIALADLGYGRGELASKANHHRRINV
jgi:hypothetical protein